MNVTSGAGIARTCVISFKSIWCNYYITTFTHWVVITSYFIRVPWCFPDGNSSVTQVGLDQCWFDKTFGCVIHSPSKYPQTDLQVCPFWSLFSDSTTEFTVHAELQLIIKLACPWSRPRAGIWPPQWGPLHSLSGCISSPQSLPTPLSVLNLDLRK